jgi:hypothetical protein
MTRFGAKPISTRLHRYLPGGGPGAAPMDASEAVQMPGSHYRTTTIERFLLMAAIVLLPLQEHIPNIGGFSFIFIIFGFLGIYVLLNRPKKLGRMCKHPVFLTAYSLIIVGSLIESLHPYSSYSEIIRIGQMIVSAIFVASLCRDRGVLRAVMYGYITMGVWVSIALFLTFMGVLREISADDFGKASQLRAEAFADNPIGGSMDKFAFLTAQGAVVALVFALTANSPGRRNLFLGVTLFSGVATFLPMSRGAILIVIILCTTILYTCRVQRRRAIIVAAILGAGIFMWVPNVVYSRMSFSTQPNLQGKRDSRARVYIGAVRYLPEYVLTGVGVGNFWGSWGMSRDFRKRNAVTGSHNIFFQVTIYWGLAGLLILLALVWQTYRCLPRHCGADVLSLCLLGVAFSVLLHSLFIHALYAKEIALAVGLLVGARYWIWPQGIVQPATQRRGNKSASAQSLVMRHNLLPPSAHRSYGKA